MNLFHLPISIKAYIIITKILFRWSRHSTKENRKVNNFLNASEMAAIFSANYYPKWVYSTYLKNHHYRHPLRFHWVRSNNTRQQINSLNYSEVYFATNSHCLAHGKKLAMCHNTLHSVWLFFHFSEPKLPWSCSLAKKAKISPAPSVTTALYPIEAQCNLRITLPQCSRQQSLQSETHCHLCLMVEFLTVCLCSLSKNIQARVQNGHLFKLVFISVLPFSQVRVSSPTWTKHPSHAIPGHFWLSHL